jgi:DNA polymerase III sliding clamp (beta) subunit (PCNA family)
VTLAYSELLTKTAYTWIVFDGDVVFRISSVVMRNTFPEYSCFIDDKKNITIECVTKDLLDAFKRIDSLADLFCLTVFSDQSPNKFLQLSAVRDKAIFSREDIPYVGLQGCVAVDMKIGGNISFMIDALNKILTEKILLELDEERKPLRITPVFDENKTGSLAAYTSVVMPIDLRFILT